jgi:hypothetical protein
MGRRGLEFLLLTIHPERRKVTVQVSMSAKPLIWSDRVNGAKSVGVAVFALSRGQSEQQPE